MNLSTKLAALADEFLELKIKAKINTIDDYISIVVLYDTRLYISEIFSNKLSVESIVSAVILSIMKKQLDDFEWTRENLS